MCLLEMGPWIDRSGVECPCRDYAAGGGMGKNCGAVLSGFRGGQQPLSRDLERFSPLLYRFETRRSCGSHRRPPSQSVPSPKPLIAEKTSGRFRCLGNAR
jgi:hypothetical protein